ncbi:MAG: (4Fe-4S)-binding protein [Ferruginibacter sp.]
MKSHTYTKDDVTILWQPDICIHSAVCARGLSEVFDPRRRPWIDMDKSTTDRIMEQVKKCPSGALSLINKI